MTHDELIENINKEIDEAAFVEGYYPISHLQALRSVAYAHKPSENNSWGLVCCNLCGVDSNYPCMTIQLIERELNNE